MSVVAIGWKPQKSVYSTRPALHASHRWSYGAPMNISGAMYCSVPTRVRMKYRLFDGELTAGRSGRSVPRPPRRGGAAGAPPPPPPSSSSEGEAAAATSGMTARGADEFSARKT